MRHMTCERLHMSTCDMSTHEHGKTGTINITCDMSFVRRDQETCN